MNHSENTILLIGESGVGKTHYGAQLLMRLNNHSGALRMDGAPSNVEPYEEAMRHLNEGKTASHTPVSVFADSVWPIIDERGQKAALHWPDYGGEQIKQMIDNRHIPAAWRRRVLAAPSWLLLVRPQNVRADGDLLSRPLADLKGERVENSEVRISDQARVIELLQMLLYVRGAGRDALLTAPRLGVLLTCWDEFGEDGVPAEPETALRRSMPMFADFVFNSWAAPRIFGLSALGQRLAPDAADENYAAQGPEHFGYVVTRDGAHSTDLTLPIKMLIAAD